MVAWRDLDINWIPCNSKDHCTIWMWEWLETDKRKLTSVGMDVQRHAGYQEETELTISK